jgi:hypothetical protein
LGFKLGVAAIIAVVALVALGALTLFINSQKQQDRTITVCSKESVATEDNGHEYRIYASDDTYVMEDNILGGIRFDTASEYGRIRDNTTYNVRIKGLRIGVFSMFPNILKAEVASEQHPELCS